MGNASHNRAGSPHSLFSEWTKIARRVHSAKRVAVFLDFDGTLVGFKKNPAEVRLEASTRSLLERLACHPRVMLAFISGRSRADLRRRVGVRGALYLGLHGFESRAGIRVSAASRRRLLAARRLIASHINGLLGIWIQDKHGCIVVHYRGAAAASAAKARAAVRHAVRQGNAPLQILPGKQMWELLAPEIKGKGEAASALVRASGRGVLPFFLGDADTDEMAFAALRGAVTVRVGYYKRTKAQYSVRNPDEVRIFLERLLDVLE
ncbi:MAG: trehalose-phosphatase [Terriglobia bacterium]